MDKRLWKRHEREIADWTGGWVTAGSGALSERADVQSQRVPWWHWIIECKSTHNKSFSMTEKLWEDVREKALNKSVSGRPVMAVRLYDEDQGPERTKVKQDWAMLSMGDFLEMIEELERLRDLVEHLEMEA